MENNSKTQKFAGPLAHGVWDLLSAGLFVKLSFDIVSPGSQGPRQRPRRAGAGLPRWTSRTLGRLWDPPFGSAKGHQMPFITYDNL